MFNSEIFNNSELKDVKKVQRIADIFYTNLFKDNPNFKPTEREHELIILAISVAVLEDTKK